MQNVSLHLRAIPCVTEMSKVRRWIFGVFTVGTNFTESPFSWKFFCPFHCSSLLLSELALCLFPGHFMQLSTKLFLFCHLNLSIEEVLKPSLHFCSSRCFSYCVVPFVFLIIWLRLKCKYMHSEKFSSYNPGRITGGDVLMSFYHSQYYMWCEMPMQVTSFALLFKVPAIQILHPKC